MYLQDLDAGAIVADALQDLLDVLHEAVVEDWFRKADMAEMTLALTGFTTGLANLVGCRHS